MGLGWGSSYTTVVYLQNVLIWLIVQFDGVGWAGCFNIYRYIYHLSSSEMRYASSF